MLSLSLSLHLQGVNPWIEVDGGVGPNNAYKVPYIYIIIFVLHPFIIYNDL